MLNIDEIQNGIVIDHIKAGTAIGLMDLLGIKGNRTASVALIQNAKAVKKEKPQPPKRLVNIVRCKNPRCISSIEEECDQIFELSSNGKYRCIYCEQELQVKPE